MARVTIVITPPGKAGMRRVPDSVSWLLDAFPGTVPYVEGAQKISGAEARGIPVAGFLSREFLSGIGEPGDVAGLIRVAPDAMPLSKAVVEDMLDDLRILGGMKELAPDVLVPDPAVFARRRFQIFSSGFLHRILNGEKFTLTGFAPPVCRSGGGVSTYAYRPSFNVGRDVWPEVKARVDSGEYPIFWQVSPGEICNLNCRMCPFHGRDSDSETVRFYERFRREHRGAVLKPETFKRMLDEIRGFLPVRKVVLTGFGEPMLNERFFDMVSYIRKAGLNYSITTNGTSLDEEKMERLMSTGIGDVNVSIDAASEDVYRRIRKGAPPLEVVETRVQRLCRLGRGCGAKVSVGFVVQDLNRAEVETFIKRWKEYDVEAIRCWQKNRLLGFEGEWWRGRFPKRKACMAPVEGLYTLADGGTSPCCGLLPVQSRRYEPGRFKALWDEVLFPFVEQSYVGPLPEPCRQCEGWANEIVVKTPTRDWDKIVTPTSVGLVRRRSFIFRVWNKTKQTMKRWQYR